MHATAALLAQEVVASGDEPTSHRLVAMIDRNCRGVEAPVERALAPLRK